jgi:transketolase
MTPENRAAIRGLPAQLGARFVDVGIAEQTMIGAAAGLALRGRTPIVHALAAFLTMRAYEFIRTDVGIAKLPVTMVGGVPGFLSDGNGPTHQAIEDVAIMRGIPGVNVFCPADEDELLAGMPVVLASKHPTYVRYYAGKARVVHHEPFALGRAETLSDGRDVAIFTYGFLLKEAALAQRILQDKGIAARLVNVRTPKPIDRHAVLSAAKECAAIVTIEDHFVTGGLFSIVAELLAREGTRARVTPIALEEKWFTPGRLQDVLHHEGFTGEQLAARIEGALR